MALVVALGVNGVGRGRLVVSGGSRRSSQVVRRVHAVRWAAPATMAYATVFPLVQVGLIAESTWLGRGYGYADGAWALLATTAYLPFYLHLVRHATEGRPAPAAGWALGALTVVVALGLPLGDLWLSTFHVVVVAALLALRPPWSIGVAAAVVAASAPLAILLDSQIQAAPAYYVATILWRSAAVFVPIWLVGAVRRLQEDRQALADEAVVRERLRIDTELRATLGTALTAIERQGRAALALVDGDRDGGRAALTDELHAVVGGARRTLTQARQVVTGYQQVTLAAELAIAASLLDAAGVATRVELPPDGVPAEVDAELRATLRAGVARLLRDDSTAAGRITVTRGPGGAVDVAVVADGRTQVARG